MIIHELAAEAAAHWQGRVIRLIRNRENAVFEIEVPGGRAALRLHRPGYQNEAAIRSELWWCESMADAGVPVSRPLRPLLVTLADGRQASAIAWIEGEPLGEAGVPFVGPVARILEQHHALGSLLAQMHGVTDGLTLPADFSRPRWDTDGLVGDAPFWGRFWDHPAATPDQHATLLRARDQLREWLADHSREAGLGPIHADVLRENVLMNDHSPNLIDFDDCGVGFRLYDLGTVMSQNLYEPARAEIQAALIDGYGLRGSAAIDAVEMFTLARVCASVGWTMPRLDPDDPVNRSHLARAVMVADQLRR